MFFQFNKEVPSENILYGFQRVNAREKIPELLLEYWQQRKIYEIHQLPRCG